MIAKVVAAVAIIAILYVSFIVWAFDPETGYVLVGFGVGMPLVIAFIVRHYWKHQYTFWITFASGLAVVAAFLNVGFLLSGFE